MCALLTSAIVNFITPSNSPLGNDDKDDDTYFDMWLFGTHGYSTTDTNISLLHTYYGQKVRFEDNGRNMPVGFDLNSRTNPGDTSPLDKETFQFCGLSVEIHPNGNDTWIFQPTITLSFDDGTSTTLSPPTPTYRVTQDSTLMTAQFNGPAPTHAVKAEDSMGGPHLPIVGPEPVVGPGGIYDPFVGPKVGVR